MTWSLPVFSDTELLERLPASPLESLDTLTSKGAILLSKMQRNADTFLYVYQLLLEQTASKTPDTSKTTLEKSRLLAELKHLSSDLRSCQVQFAELWGELASRVSYPTPNSSLNQLGNKMLEDQLLLSLGPILVRQGMESPVSTKVVGKGSPSTKQTQLQRKRLNTASTRSLPRKSSSLTASSIFAKERKLITRPSKRFWNLIRGAVKTILRSGIKAEGGKAERA